MPYIYETESKDYSDYASGRVFYNAPGQPVLPIRLTQEIFQRARALLDPPKQEKPLTLYDPCCGSAYHLATLAYHHWPRIGRIIASDIDPTIVPLAKRNLGLLEPDLLAARQTEIATLFENFGKASHREALQSVGRLGERLAAYRTIHPIATEIFQADGTDTLTLKEKLKDQAIDLVLTDVPYGHFSRWEGGAIHNKSAEPPVYRLLETLAALVHEQSIIALVSDKGQKVSHPLFKRVDRFQIGKRRIIFLKKG